MERLAAALMRSGTQIEVARQAAIGALPDARNGYVRGAMCAYAWVLGEGVAPVSADAVEVTLETMRREENLADDAIYGYLAGEGVDRHYAVGAQTALMWLRGADPDPAI